MAILTNAGKSDIHRGRPQDLADATHHFVWITIAVKQVILRDPGLMNQPLKKVLAKTGRVSDGQSDVFIEVKHLDSLPVDVFCSGQGIQKIQLRRSRCDDDTRSSVIEDGTAHGSRGLFGSSAAERDLIFEHPYNHSVPSLARNCLREEQ